MIVIACDSLFISIHVHELFLNVFLYKKIINKNENDEDGMLYTTKPACLSIPDGFKDYLGERRELTDKLRLFILMIY